MQDQEANKFIVESAEAMVEPSLPLPDAYGDDRLVILPRDPHFFFSYWELTADRTQAARRDHGSDIFERAQQVMRVYDVTGQEGNNVDPRRFFDVPITFNARQWYVHVDESGRPYIADLGLRLPDGQFIVLLRSNRIWLPAGRVSDQTDSQWMAVNHTTTEEEWNKLMQISGAEHIGRGSAEISRVMAQRWEFLRSVFSGSMVTASLPEYLLPGSSAKLSSPTSSWAVPVSSTPEKKS